MAEEPLDVQLHLMVGRGTSEALKRRASEMGVSVGEVVRSAIGQYLSRVQTIKMGERGGYIPSDAPATEQHLTPRRIKMVELPFETEKVELTNGYTFDSKLGTGTTVPSLNKAREFRPVPKKDSQK